MRSKSALFAVDGVLFWLAWVRYRLRFFQYNKGYFKNMEVWNYGDNKEICKLLFSDTRKKILFNGSMAECVEYLKKHGIAVGFYGLCSEKIKYSRI